jgi:hypothetical protein
MTSANPHLAGHLDGTSERLVVNFAHGVPKDGGGVPPARGNCRASSAHGTGDHARLGPHGLTPDGVRVIKMAAKAWRSPRLKLQVQSLATDAAEMTPHVP